LKRFQFTSSLKRMTCIVQPDMSSAFYGSQGGPPSREHVLVVVKGAPEVLQDMILNCPVQYEQIYKDHAIAGSRVLAFGWKWLKITSVNLKTVNREILESDLEYGGFLIFTSSLKAGTADSINELRESMHRVSFAF
jgi:manganese-transporting P-type ATPase